MPIKRQYEYAIWCDAENCPDGQRAYVYGSHTRQQAELDAEQHGWVRCTRGRWLCARCAEKARAMFERPETMPVPVSSHFLEQL